MKTWRAREIAAALQATGLRVWFGATIALEVNSLYLLGRWKFRKRSERQTLPLVPKPPMSPQEHTLVAQ
jgi:hypothetical protein